MRPVFALISFIIMLSCAEHRPDQFTLDALKKLPALKGKKEYLASPFVTAGNRVYMIGHQNGKFPDLGWHIQGEMGGIWNHPIKLMDGFRASITIGENDDFCLDNADSFTNYPLANTHTFSLRDENLLIERTQFVPDETEGLVVAFRFINQGQRVQDLKFSFTGMPDLRPTWLGERTDMHDSNDKISYRSELKAFIAKDSINTWYTAFGSATTLDAQVDSKSACQPMKSKLTGTLTFNISIPAGEDRMIPVYIAGSAESESALLATLDKLRSKSEMALQRKITRYDSITTSSVLTIPDTAIQEMYQWLKYNTDWLIRTVPTQGTALSAGLPDYPWWFGCDNTYALQGVLATGNHTIARQTIHFLFDISRKTNNNGRIVHEVSSNGSVYNPGNVNETAQTITLLLNYYSWTGDKATITKYWPDVKQGIKWLLQSQDPDGNGYPNGNGMMEIHGLDKEMIDVVAYTQQALESASILATHCGEPGTASEYEVKASELRKKINNEWWQARSKSFADFIGTNAEARAVIDAAIVRADTLQKPWAVAELRELKQELKGEGNGAHVVYHNWVVNTPLETGVADSEKAFAALQTTRKYENPFGVFVTGIDRTEAADSVVLKSRQKVFSYTGAVMTLPTGINAIAWARYGKPDESLAYIKKLNRSFSYALPGSMYEVSPDFGMFTQAWNIYGVAVPIINYFFGIQPRAYEQTVHLAPMPPSEWKSGTLENVRVGDNTISVNFERLPRYLEFRVSQTNPAWKFTLDRNMGSKVLIGGKEVPGIDQRISLTGKEVTIQIYP